jgi:hypothetical protein
MGASEMFAAKRNFHGRKSAEKAGLSEFRPTSPPAVSQYVF